MIWLLCALLFGALSAWYASSQRLDLYEAKVFKRARASMAHLMNHGIFARLRQNERHDRFIAACVGEVPQMIDILTLGLSAGLSFDASLGLYCERSHTKLSELMKKTRLSWTMGLASRSEALHSLAQAVHSAALERFAQAVTESLTFGAPLVETLVRQSAAIRADHRREVEEAIEKVPVKMLIPMGVLVVPAMLLAVMGPLVVSALVKSS